jgi:hypothetical protein
VSGIARKALLGSIVVDAEHTRNHRPEDYLLKGIWPCAKSRAPTLLRRG